MTEGFTGSTPADEQIICDKCDRPIYVSNHADLLEEPELGPCWHTVDDDNALCDGPDESTDAEVLYFHRPPVTG